MRKRYCDKKINEEIKNKLIDINSSFQKKINFTQINYLLF